MKIGLNIQRAFGVLVVLAVGIGYFLYLRGTIHDVEPLLRPVEEPAIVGDLTDLVNVFIGTTGGGHVFPGATLPHGMVKAGMDTDSPGNHAGYDADPRYNVIGFSQLHDDGTGGNIPLSNFKLFPLSHCRNANSTDCPTTRRMRRVPRQFKYAIADFAPNEHALPGGGVADDYGSPGYFSTNLTGGIRVELTATRRTALHRYTFPSQDENEQNLAYNNADDWRPRLIVDITNDGMGTGTNPFLNIDNSTGRVMGGAEFYASFGVGSYHAFVCVDFRSSSAPSQPFLPEGYGTFSGSIVTPNSTNLAHSSWGERGAILTFPGSSRRAYAPRAPLIPSNAPLSILARVGISLISAQKACSNAESEIPDFDFERVRETARKEWNELLGRFEISGEEGTKERDTAVLFYSSLYRSHVVPADYSDENPKWMSGEPYYDSLYCNWDTYRTLFPLMSLHDPETYARIVRSFIDVQKHEGWLPECRGATLKQFIQGGSSGDPILAELYIKYKDYMDKLGISPEDLYEALVKDAEVEPANWDFMGRQTTLWKEYGYIPSGIYKAGGMGTRQVSRTLEYSFDDFTIAQVAKEMNKTGDWSKYANRSRGFELVWNPETTINNTVEEVVEGVRGFMQPRYANGSFGHTDPRHCTVHDPKHSTCFLDGGNKDGFYEGGPIVYSQYVPHDTAKLIEMQGGREAFIRRLDFIFDNGYFDSTNEPSQQIPYMYHYAHRPGLSTERSRQTIAQSYNTSVNGLPGNDDSGAMGSYVFFYMLGLYPLPATRQFLISSPHFRKVRIHNPLLRTVTTINAHGFEGNPDDGVGGNIYVKNITINGKPWHSNCYVEWHAFEIGATINLELTDDRTVACGADDSALPPSLSTGGYDV